MPLPKIWTCSRLLNLLESEDRRGAHITQVGQWFQPWGELGKGGYSGKSNLSLPRTGREQKKATERGLIPASASSFISLPEIPSSDSGYCLPDVGGAGTAPRRHDGEASALGSRAATLSSRKGCRGSRRGWGTSHRQDQNRSAPPTRPPPLPGGSAGAARRWAPGLQAHEGWLPPWGPGILGLLGLHPHSHDRPLGS